MLEPGQQVIFHPAHVATSEEDGCRGGCNSSGSRWWRWERHSSRSTTQIWLPISIVKGLWKSELRSGQRTDRVSSLRVATISFISRGRRDDDDEDGFSYPIAFPINTCSSYVLWTKLACWTWNTNTIPSHSSYSSLLSLCPMKRISIHTSTQQTQQTTSHPPPSSEFLLQKLFQWYFYIRGYN